MNWIPFGTSITDEDVERVKEYDLIGYQNLTEEQKQEWNSGMKGALNCSDINRIENNIGYLAERTLISLNIKTNWNYDNIFDLNNANRILINIQQLCRRFKFTRQPNIPGTPLNDYRKINYIEELLHRMYAAVGGIILPNFITSDSKEIQMQDTKFFSCWIPPYVFTPDIEW